jgi:hypothetical protein
VNAVPAHGQSLQDKVAGPCSSATPLPGGSTQVNEFRHDRMPIADEHVGTPPDAVVRFVRGGRQRRRPIQNALVGGPTAA